MRWPCLAVALDVISPPLVFKSVRYEVTGMLGLVLLAKANVATNTNIDLR